MSIQDEAARVIERRKWQAMSDAAWYGRETKCGSEDIARALANAELLAPDLSEVTRLTVAGGGYRQMEEWGICDVTPQLQDEGRTLKIFYRKDGNK